MTDLLKKKLPCLNSSVCCLGKKHRAIRFLSICFAFAVFYVFLKTILRKYSSLAIKMKKISDKKTTLKSDWRMLHAKG